VYVAVCFAYFEPDRAELWHTAQNREQTGRPGAGKWSVESYQLFTVCVESINFMQGMRIQ
jgi:hypothetical protein